LNAIRTAINPARLEYFAGVFRELGVDPAGKSVVDIGCGGGLFAEEFARLSARVVGVGRMSYGEFGRRARFVVNNDLRVSYAGCATKAA
jgi:hypothetical protein